MCCGSVCLWVVPNLNCVNLQSLGHLGNGETEATECTTKLLFFCRYTHFLSQVKLNSDLLTICWKFTQMFEKIHFQKKKKHGGEAFHKFSDSELLVEGRFPRYAVFKGLRVFRVYRAFSYISESVRRIFLFVFFFSIWFYSPTFY